VRQRILFAAVSTYRGRLAPSPTGYLHVGHARTFWIAWDRARRAGGQIILRNDDLDRSRVRPEFVSAMFEDLRWLGLDWSEGPDIGGPAAPYSQSERISLYRSCFERLRASGAVYPCTCSRQDVLRSIQAPHAGEEEPIYPGTCRDRQEPVPGYRVNWRFRVPDGRTISFTDEACGAQSGLAGRDFGDFVIWRADDLPAYQLACVVDDSTMGITEVVRGADLLLSTARQIVLYEALGLTPPRFFHTPLITDAQGVRLAKRHDSLSIRHLRKVGFLPSNIVHYQIDKL
jgi:glutamyl/glutaminyl-tRNA synthetase